MSQQLKLLEAYDIVQHTKEEKQRVGKPRKLYALKKSICELTFARSGFAKKHTFHPGQFQELLLNTLFLAKQDDQDAILRALFEHKDLFSCAIAHVKTSQGKVEVLLVTDNVEKIRKSYSTIKSSKDIVAWTHSLEEIQEGLAKKDKHFVELLRSHHVVYDPNRIFLKIKG